MTVTGREENDTPATSDPAANRPLAPRSARLIGLAALATLALLALDLGTKHWALESLSTARAGAAPPVCEEVDGARRTQRVASEGQAVAGEVLSLDYAENCSAAFGLAGQLPAPVRRGLLAAAALVAVMAIFVALARGHGGPAFAWGVPFVAAGALGNMIDRLRLGYVVDFIHVQYRPWDFDYPVFNVADILIAIGVALLVIGASGRGEAPGGQHADPRAA